MKFYSTRDEQRQLVGFKTALLQGLAEDGGLYMPETIPVIAEDQRKGWENMSFVQLAGHVAHAWFDEDFPRDELDPLVAGAYDFGVELKDVTPQRTIAELFHGPSLSFKDFAAQFLMRVLDNILKDEDQKALILTATSGDTGSAVATACSGRSRIRAVVLYPQGRISAVQEQQIATWGGNVQAIAVNGDFDACQALVKARLGNAAPARWAFTSANSINIGRLLPQTFYYWYVALKRGSTKQPVSIAVPSGNVGNLTAGVLAKRMGAPIGNLYAITNCNDALTRYLKNGDYQPHATRPTVSNAMDVGDPSNFERLLHLYDHDYRKMAQDITSVSIDDTQTKATMKAVADRQGYQLDPHTAVAWAGAAQLAAEGERVVVLATAHPAKFPDIVHAATGSYPVVPERLRAQMDLDCQAMTLEVPELEYLNLLLDIVTM